jgi:addiction module HigA family antidote
VYPEIIARAKLQAGLRLRNPGQRSSDVACAAQGGFETRPYMRRRTLAQSREHCLCLRRRSGGLSLGARDMPMKNPPHPGRSVRHDCLEPLGLRVTDAARKLGVNRKQLSDVLNGHSGISPEMAIRLHKAFGGGADTWFRLQAAYDLAQAMKKEKRIKVERITRAA